ncbi:hypothetical protein [Pseudonocardia parietis]|uniref:Uncharacterized protein n=1 Tax=Pseudonocardia parietis TaxID=570936 RepID=A0ABS4W255_9PSEU|nr:hypothetical protein [Pseudonocardia parietis]MBP2370274.1 hypothetical protein [Pseudonocardia parietis]
MQFGMWRKPGHEKVGKDARLMYHTILLDETLNQAGVVRLSIDMWADDAAMTREEAEAALAELRGGRFVVVDGYELLVRTFIRNDGVADQPNILRNALDVARLIRSPMLRRAVAEELRKLPPAPPPKTNEKGKTFVYPDPHAVADEIDPGDLPPPDSEPFPEPFANPSGTHPESNPSRTLPGTPWGRGRGSSSPSCSVDGDLEAPPAHARTHASAHTRAAGTAAALNRIGPAHSANAYRLVQTYAGTCNRRPTAKILSQLAVEVDALLDEDWPTELIADVLTAWGSKSLGPAALQAVAHEVANRPAARDAPRRTRTTDDKRAAVAGLVAEVLGDPTRPDLRAIEGGTG